MQTIKKYANRKLYHLNRKQYITLDGIAALIQSGEQVQVIDNESGEDITAAILSQVALQARSSRVWPSAGTLTDMIRMGGDTIAEVGRTLFSGLGGHTLFDAEIARRIDRLAAQEAISPEEATRMRRLLLSAAGDTSGELPSRADIEQLRQQVDALTTLVEELLEREPERQAPQQG
jgi:polyhydroxyalkanoate synthesis repressor PhaR